MVSNVSSISYTGVTHSDDRRVSAGDVGVATGATLGSAKYGMSALKKFQKITKGKDLVTLSSETAANIKKAATIDKQVNTLWKRMMANAKTYKEAIIKYAQKTATGKLATKVVKSKAFGKASALVGGIGAVFVFISGLGEINNTVGKLFGGAQAVEEV